MDKILNLTQHKSTKDQREAGVVDLGEADRAHVTKMLTFGMLPSKHLVFRRAEDLADFAYKKAGEAGTKNIMIGGAPYLMPPLVEALKARGLVPHFAFSVRDVVEKEENGKVIKTSVFKHKGFIIL